MTGQDSALGQNMARAASLVVQDSADGQLPAFDTKDTAEGASAAAAQALAGGARMLLGPLRADQTPAVLAMAGGVPVVTFSNDDRLAEQGTFVMGITPAQSVAAALSYARAQGVRRVAVVSTPGPLGEATATAARQLAGAGGLELTAVLTRESGAPDLVPALRSESGGTLPDAVFLPDGGSDLIALADALAGTGPRLMGGVQWGVLDIAEAPQLEGSWFAAPPPDRFVRFLDTFQARFGEPGGVVTALGHDAALMAAILGSAGALDRGGLTRSEGFAGVLGGFRFLEDGRCQRDLAVVTVEGGQIVTIGEVTGA
jgi:ABC-type branched-subunit amino acid transport system substrate-binding protein